jgi:hypothetical protein
LSHFVTCLLQLHILADLFSFSPYFSISFHLSHMTMPQDVLSFIKIKNSKYIRWIVIILVYYYKLEVCLIVWMLYKLVYEYLVNMLLKQLICIHTLAHLTIYGLIVIHVLLWYFFNWDFNSNLFIKSINCCLLFLWLLSSKMSILKSFKTMNGQSFGDFWINAFNVLRNMEIKEEWFL